MADADFLRALSQYNATRDFAGKGFKSLCYAPSVSMYFDQFGDVRACCQNTAHLLGNVARMSIDEIWMGAQTQALRDSLAHSDLRSGCEFCEWQLRDGNIHNTFMRRFDAFAVADPRPAFPVQMEFSISNTCNLECEMCNGDWSHLIRAKREQRAPLPKIYGERFFEELAPYLPRLKQANFLGGEPFLATETMRILEMLVETGEPVSCWVTTNGTRYNARVERILESLPVSLVVSLDGATKETYESIRKNADHGEVMENVRRFRDYTRRRGTSFFIAHCLLVPNWREFDQLLLFAEENDADVVVNTVTRPNHLSLYMLPRAELMEVVAALEAKRDAVAARLTRNRRVWLEEIERLRNRLDHHEDRHYFEDWGGRFVERRGSAEKPLLDDEDARRQAIDWSGRPAAAVLTCDRERRVIAIESPDDSPLGWRAETIVGHRDEELMPMLMERFGGPVSLVAFEQSEQAVDTIVGVGPVEGPKVEVRALSIPTYDASGVRNGVRTYVAVRDAAPATLVEISTSATRPRP